MLAPSSCRYRETRPSDPVIPHGVAGAAVPGHRGTGRGPPAPATATAAGGTRYNGTQGSWASRWTPKRLPGASAVTTEQRRARARRSRNVTPAPYDQFSSRLLENSEPRRAQDPRPASVTAAAPNPLPYWLDAVPPRHHRRPLVMGGAFPATAAFQPCGRQRPPSGRTARELSPVARR